MQYPLQSAQKHVSFPDVGVVVDVGVQQQYLRNNSSGYAAVVKFSQGCWVLADIGRRRHNPNERDGV
jgi:hypothetical protein